MGSVEAFVNALRQHPLLALLSFFIVYLFGRTIYRLCFHPLSKFPGPKLAAVTYQYEAYYDIIKGGQYTNAIWKMHEKYGPVVRINPDELHASDPAWIDQIYAVGGKRRNKFSYYTKQFGVNTSTFGTVAHEAHRLRRNALNRYFSKSAVAKVEFLIHEKAQRLCDQLEVHAGSKNPVELSEAYSCYATDVVSEYSYARSFNYLANSDFKPNLRTAIAGGEKTFHVLKQFPWMIPVMNSIPDAWTGWLMPDMILYLKFQSDMRRDIAAIKAEGGDEYKKGTRLGSTVFHEILQSDLPDPEKGTTRLAEEGQLIIGAGTETMAWTLSGITTYLLAQPKTLAALRAELNAAIPDPKNLPPWSTLEKLPFLTGTILEGLRLTYGIATHSSRIAPDEVLQLKSSSGDGKVYHIPRGTPVGMTTVIVHHNEDIFPDSRSFTPERWIDKKGQTKYELQKYLLSFSKGSRQCLGMNVAYAELYIGVTAAVLRVINRMELFETSLENDVMFDHEEFVPMPKPGSKGVRVLIN